MKDHLDYKLVNLLIFVLIIYLINGTSDIWVNIVDILKNVLFPFFIAFILSYAFYPTLKFLNKKIPKLFSILLILVILIGIFFLFTVSVLPIIINQIVPLLDNIIYFLKEIGIKYNINFNFLYNFITNIYDIFLEKTGNYLMYGIPSAISISVNIITKIIIVLASFCYFLNDMGKIRSKIKFFLLKYNKKLFNYVYGLDIEMNKYLVAQLQIIIISFFEYLFFYFIIGHPKFILLAFLAAIANLIPYFGGLIVNLVAFITAFISPSLLLKTCFIWIICGIIDGYIIQPIIYDKKNNIHPLIVIFSLFAFGFIFGFMGIILSMPIAILLVYSFKFISKK
jgi:predicted PurR-regulated permease PerM